MAEFFIKLHGVVYTITSRVVLHPESFRAVLAFRGTDGNRYVPFDTVFAVETDENCDVAPEYMLALHPVIVQELTREIENMLVRENNKFEYVEYNSIWNDAIEAAAGLVLTRGEDRKYNGWATSEDDASAIRELKR